MATAGSSTAKPKRSQFIEKLHGLLESPLDAESLRWCGPDSFEITCNEQKARAALSPSFNFRSLSSFIRQLSYYNFKRLSDRRRSSERRSSATAFIVFTHPSGFFLRGDSTQLEGISRKTRARPDKQRRASAVSTGSVEDVPAPVASTSTNAWPAPPDYRYPLPQAAAVPNASLPQSTYAYGPPAPHLRPYHSPQMNNDPHANWRGYTPSLWPNQQIPPPAPDPRFAYAPIPPNSYSHSDPHSQPQHNLDRRHSIGDPTGLSPRSKASELLSLPPVGVRKAHSPLGMHDPHAVTEEHHQQFQSAYPTPSFSSANIYERPPQYPAPLAPNQPNAPPQVPTGLAMGYEHHQPPPPPPPQGQGQDGGLSSMPYPTYPPPPSQHHLPPLYQHLHQPQHTRHASNDVLPSPTYSSDDDAAARAHAHAIAQSRRPSFQQQQQQEIPLPPQFAPHNAGSSGPPKPPPGPPGGWAPPPPPGQAFHPSFGAPGAPNAGGGAGANWSPNMGLSPGIGGHGTGNGDVGAGGGGAGT
ncbi:hypothetical protein JCM1840_000940 [Sporobolomyces johnsonii]